MNLLHLGRLYAIMPIVQGGGDFDVLEAFTSGKGDMRYDIDYEWGVFGSRRALARLQCYPIDDPALFRFCRELRETKVSYFRVLSQYRGKYPTGGLMVVVRRARKVMARAHKALSDCGEVLPTKSKDRILTFLKSIQRHLDEIVKPPKESIAAAA